jgi:hypothetical protein
MNSEADVIAGYENNLRFGIVVFCVELPGVLLRLFEVGRHLGS